MLVTRTAGKIIRNLHLLVTLQAAVSGICLHEKAKISLRPHRALGQKLKKKMDTEAAILWNILPKLVAVSMYKNFPLIFPLQLQ